MNITPIKCSYLAGYFDGEGTFSITKRPSRKASLGFEYQPYVSVASCNEDIIIYLLKLIGKGYRYYRIRNNPNARDAHEMQITGMKSIIEFIDFLIPYLVLKKEVAKTLKEFCLLRIKANKNPVGFRGYTEEHIVLFDRIRFLNRKGKKLDTG